jgi:hypothetical protein
MSNSSSCTIIPVSNVAQQNMSSGVSSEATHSAGLSASIHNNPPEVRHRLVFVIIAVLFILCHNALIDCPQLNKNGKKRRKSTMAAMSPFVETMTADVIAEASAVMTVPTKTRQ